MNFINAANRYSAFKSQLLQRPGLSTRYMNGQLQEAQRLLI